MRKAIVVLPFVLGGCFSLFNPWPSKKTESKPLEPTLDGRIFGAGQTLLDAWDLEIKAQGLFVTDEGGRLHVQNKEGDTIDLAGTWSLDVYPKGPDDTAASVLARRSIDLMGREPYGTYDREFLDLGFDGIDGIVAQTDAMTGWLYVGVHGNCVYEFLAVGANDGGVSVTVWNSARAGIVAIGGGTPEPDACQ